jgi:hypothetical protein
MRLNLSNVTIGYDEKRGVFALRSDRDGLGVSDWQICEDEAELYECKFSTVESISPLNLGRIEKLYREGLLSGLFDTIEESLSKNAKAVEKIELELGKIKEFFIKAKRVFALDARGPLDSLRQIEILCGDILRGQSSIRGKLKKEDSKK